MNTVMRYSIVVCILLSQTMQSTSSWKFWQKDELKETEMKVEKMEEIKQETKAQDEAQAFINQHEKAVVLFTLTGCPYCKYLEPLFEKLVKEFSGKVHFKIIQVNGEKAYYKKQFKLSSFPTVIYYLNRQEKERHGSDFKKMTVAKMREYVESSFEF